MIEVRKSAEFDAAHSLPNHPGVCQRLHGHRWRVTVCVRGEINADGPAKGMVVDFGRVSQLMSSVILGLDHRMLNEVIENPTAENIAAVVYSELCFDLPGIAWVEVRETPNSVARYYAPDGLP